MENEEAYIVGYTVGDGNLYSRVHVFSIEKNKHLTEYQITWGDKDVEQLETIRCILKQKFPEIKFSVRDRKNSKGKVLRCSRKVVYKYLETLLSKNIENEIPSNIAKYISGFFDAEGSVSLTLNRKLKDRNYYKIRIEAVQKDKELLKKLQKLLITKFAIKSSIYKKWNQDAYVIKLSGNKQAKKFKEKIDFQNPTKNAKLNKLLSSV